MCFLGYRDSAAKFLDAVLDLDLILASDPHFLLGRWLEDAKAWARSADEKILYEYNARNQITLWGPNGEVRYSGARYMNRCLKYTCIVFSVHHNGG